MGKSSLSRDMVKKGWRIVCGHIRPPLQEPVAGMVCLVFHGPPPTATHHAKDMKIFHGRPVMKNRPELQEAHNYYARQLPPLQVLRPIKGPIYADVTFWIPLPVHADPLIGERPGYPCQDKPDRDNAVKVLFDELAIAGWIDRDEQITDGPIRKRWAFPDQAGVVVWLFTLDHVEKVKPCVTSMRDAFERAGQLILGHHGSFDEDQLIYQHYPPNKQPVRRSGIAPIISQSKKRTRQNRSHAEERTPQ